MSYLGAATNTSRIIQMLILDQIVHLMLTRSSFIFLIDSITAMLVFKALYVSH